MSNSDDYTWVKGHIRHKPSRRSKGFRRKCAFCKGTGIQPGSIMGDVCPVCTGGWINFEGDIDDYNTCGRCSGSGIEPHSIYTEPCSSCDGAGIV